MTKLASAVVVAAVFIGGCGTCPSPEGAKKVLQPIMPQNFTILGAGASREVPSLCEVAVAIDKQNMIVYLDKNKKYVFSGSVIELATRKNITQQKQQSLAPKDAKSK